MIKPLERLLSSLVIYGSLTGVLTQTAYANEQMSQVNEVAALQSYVERYIDHSLATAPWSRNKPWQWGLLDFKVIGHGTFGNRDYVVGSCYWNHRKCTVYAIAQKVDRGWSGCGYSVGSAKEHPGPIQWSKMGYSRKTSVVFGTVSDSAIKKVRVYFIKSRRMTVASVDSNGFFLKPVPMSGRVATGIMVEGLDRSNRVVYSDPLIEQYGWTHR